MAQQFNPSDKKRSDEATTYRGLLSEGTTTSQGTLTVTNKNLADVIAEAKKALLDYERE